MGRHATRTYLLSLDTIAIIKSLYPNIADFYYEHLRDTGNTIHTYYSAMRHDYINQDLEHLIESAVDWELRNLDVTRDEYATVPSLLPLLEQTIQTLSSYEIETQSQLLSWLKVTVARMSKQTKLLEQKVP